MTEPKVTLPRNWFIALVVGVCVLSAAIGSGLALLAQEGPAGPAGAAGKQGPRGPAGPQGPEGASSTDELGGLEAELDELRGGVEELESQLSDLEGGLLEGDLDADLLCEEFGIC